MGNTTFFSFLGTNDYVPLRYGLGDKFTTSQRERFVQAAILQYLRSVEDEPQRVVTALTKVARNKHWEALSSRFEQLGFRPEPVDIPDGKSEEELWAIFARIGACLGEKDRVVLDLTHGFRTLPVTSVLALSFFRHALSLDHVQVYYGAAEALGDLQSLRKKPEEEIERLVAPIFDLTPMYALPDWSEAVAEWQRTGRADGILERVTPYTKALRREMQAQAPQALTGLPKKLQLLGDALTLVRQDQVAKAASDVVTALDRASQEIDGHARLEPLRHVLGQVRGSVARLKASYGSWADLSDDYLYHQLDIACWLGDHKRVVEAFSVLRELVTSCAVRIAVSAGIGTVGDAPPSDKRFRGEVDGVMAALTGAVQADRGPEGPLAGKLKAWLDAHPPVAKCYQQAYQPVQRTRNRLDHCWIGDEHARERFNDQSLARVQQRFGEAVEAVRALVGATNKTTTKLTAAPGGSVFLNVSNHPVATWQPRQVEAAVQLGFGEPTDLPGGVGEVDPELDGSEVEGLARDIAERAVAAGAQGAFVATEPTLGFALVRELRRRGIRCFAATTRREVTTTQVEDGSTVKQSRFAFVRWREYPDDAS
jgi:CRISPR-associated DxTHG motif protein